jgi:glycosyltransferase involved in cell wall biosynthesis
MAGLARWDAATAGRVDRFLANSQYVAGRIQRYYNRCSTVVYPPVDTTFYTPDAEPGARDAGYLVVSALVPYKRVDVAIEACTRAGARLTVVGRGPELSKLQELGGKSVEFAGWLPDEEVRRLYRQSRAVLLPGVEDFGMVPVEAQACGTPVVALAQGGAAETILDGVSGVLVTDRSADAFADGLRRVTSIPLDRVAIRANAARFSKERFMTDFQTAVDEAIAGGPARW